MYGFNNKSHQELHIEELSQRRIKDPNDCNLITLKNTLSEQIHNSTLGNQRFLLELLQNADDAAKNSTDLEVNIAQVKDYFIFSHNGQPFSKEDVEKICDNAQNKYVDKINNVNKIGYKGTGFKAVFKISNWVYIQSGGYSFRFDKEGTYKNYAWQIMPIWTPAHRLPSEVKDYIKGQQLQTAFIIRANPAVNLNNQLNDILYNLQIMLFLPNVSTIAIKSEWQKIPKIIRRTKTMLNNMVLQDLYEGNQIKESWLTKTFIVPITSSMQAHLPKDEHECPQRLRTAKQIELVLAAKINIANNKIEKIASGKLYCYFPTTMSTSLPVFVNTQFLLNSERTQIVANQWNQALIKLIPEKLCLWMATLAADNTYGSQTLCLLPPESIGYENNFSSSYAQGQQEAFDNISFIPTTSGQLAKLNEVWIDETEFYHTFPMLQQTMNIQNKLVISHLSYLHFIKAKLKDRIIDANRLALKLPELLKEHAISKEIKEAMLRYVFKKFHANPILFQNAAIIYTISNEFRSAKEDLYFFPKDCLTLQSLQISLMAEDLKRFVHPDSFSDMSEYNEFLLGIGVKKFDNIQIIRLIAKYLQSGASINDANQLANITKFIFDNQDSLTELDWRALNQLEVIFKPHGPALEKCSTRKAWLATEYQPAFDIEKYEYKKSYFIHSDYIKLGGEIIKWASFFRKLGVADNIGIEILDRIELSQIPQLIPVFGESYVHYLKRKYKIETGTIKNFIYFRFEVFDLAYTYPDITEMLINHLNDKFYRLRNHRMELSSGNTYSITIDLNIIQYFFQNYPVLQTEPDRDRKIFRKTSIECYKLTNQNDLIQNFGLPILDSKVNLSSEAKRYLGIHTELNVTEYYQFLERLSSNLSDNNALSLNNIYLQLFQAILSSSPAIISELTRKLKNWNGKLPTQSNEFKPKSEVFGFSLKEIEMGNSACWLKKYPTFNEMEISKLYSLFSLDIITDSDTRFNPKNATTDNEIAQLIFTYLEYISAVEASASNQSGQFLQQTYTQKIKNLTFYKAEEIVLVLKNKNSPPLQQLMFTYDGNSIYLKFGLNPLTFDSFCNFLSQYLNLSKKTRDVLKIVLSFKDHKYIQWYLQEQGYNLEHLKQTWHQPIIQNQPSLDKNINHNPLLSPIKKLDEPSPREINFDLVLFNKVKSKSVNNTLFLPNSLTLPFPLNLASYPVSTFSESDETEKQSHRFNEIGRWGEELIYRWHIWHYHGRLNNAKYQEVNGCYTIIGNHKTKLQPFHIQINWHNFSKETYKSRDLTITKNGKDKVIEVKTTMSQSNLAPPANLTRPEMLEMKRQGQHYRFFRVFGAFSSKPSIVKYVDPAKMIECGEIEATAIRLKL